MRSETLRKLVPQRPTPLPIPVEKSMQATSTTTALDTTIHNCKDSFRKIPSDLREGSTSTLMRITAQQTRSIRRAKKEPRLLWAKLAVYSVRKDVLAAQ